jgi:cell division protein FtsB
MELKGISYMAQVWHKVLQKCRGKMKNSLKTIVLILFISGISGISSFAGTDPNDIKEVKEKNLFVLKANKKLLGANIEVLHSNGEVVTAQILTKRKMIIDFSDVKKGEYTIRITKGKQQEEFQYSKS